MAAWHDNTLAVFQEHYVAGSVVLKTRLGVLARQAATDMVTTRTGFTVQIRPDATGRATDGTSAQVSCCSPRPRRSYTGWLPVSSTSTVPSQRAPDLDGSPFVRLPGRVVPREPSSAYALVCPNAVITPDHAPGLRRFDDQVIEEHRRSLDPVVPAHRWVP